MQHAAIAAVSMYGGTLRRRREYAGVRRAAGRGRRSAFDRLVWYVGLSNVGSGLAYPYSGLYLVTRTSIGVSAVAAYFGVMAVCNFGTGLLLAGVRGRTAPGLLGGTGYGVLAIAYVGLAAATGLWTILLVAAVIGVGRGIAAAGSSPFTVQLTGEKRRRGAFGRQYQAMNVGLGLGALLASALLVGLSPRVLPMIFVLNGLSFLPIAVFMLRRAAPRYRQSTEGEAVDRLSLRRLLALAGPVALLQFAISVFGFSQFESTMPLVAHRLNGASLGFVSLVVAANTVAVIALQGPVVRWLDPHGPEFGVRVAAAFWIGGYLTTAGISLLPGVAPLGGLLLLGVVFAGGEAAFSCSYQPLLLASVPGSAATRAASLSNVASSAGTTLGPSVGALLLGTGSAVLVWGSLGVSCVGLLMLMRFAGPRRDRR